MVAGQTFTNGHGAHTSSSNYGERLTVERVDKGYSVTRYLVVDRFGRHGWAY